MDLSDGSDVEADVDLDQMTENALLGSDDEEYVETGHEDYNEEDRILQAEDGDVLELELNEDYGLEFGDDPDGSNRNTGLAPVQVRPSAVYTQHHSAGQSSLSFKTRYGEQEDFHNDNYEYDDEIRTGDADIDDDDEDEDSGNTRSRFLSERNTGNMNMASNSSVGNPIQTLGSGKPIISDNRQNNWVPQGPNHRQQRPRFPHQRYPQPPRPGFNQFHRQGGPRMNEPRITQFQGRIFTDFHQPMRIPNPHQPHGVRQPGPNLSMGIPPRNGNETNGAPLGNINQHPRFFNPRFQNNRMPQPRMHPRGPRMQQRPQWRNHRSPGHNFPNMPQNSPPQQSQSGGQFLPPQNQQMFQIQHNQQHPYPQQFLEQGIRQDMMNPAPFSLFPNPQLQPHPPGIFPGGPLLGSGPPLQIPIRPPPELQSQNISHQIPFFQAQAPPPRPPHIQQHFIPDQCDQRMLPQSQQMLWPQRNADPNINANSWMNSQSSNFIPPQRPVETLHSIAQNSVFQQSVEQPINRIHQSSAQMELQQSQQHPRDRQTYQPNTSSYADQRPSDQTFHQPPAYNKYENFDKFHASQQLNVSPGRDSYDRKPEKYFSEERLPVKRRYENDSRRNNSPEKRRNGGLQRERPPASSQSPQKDPKREELLKIREETKKTMGLDDDYIKKVEDQQKLREKILRQKAESRRKLNTTDAGATESKPSGQESNQEIAKGSGPGRPVIYVNPKAFALKKVGDRLSPKVPEDPSNSSKSGKLNSGQTKTVLRITKDKHGNIISKSKVKMIVVRKQQAGRTATETY